MDIGKTVKVFTEPEPMVVPPMPVPPVKTPEKVEEEEERELVPVPAKRS